MTEILTQEEINELIDNIASGKIDTTDSYYPSIESGRRIKRYDFRRPDKFSATQIRTIQMIHETFARQATMTISALTGKRAGVHVASVDQLAYEEFIGSIPNPTTISIINMAPLDGPFILEIDQPMVFQILDNMPGEILKRKQKKRIITDIEKSTLEGVLEKLIKHLCDSWTGIIKFNPSLASIQTDPESVLVVPPNDMIILVTFEFKIGDHEGMMSLCIPWITISKIMRRLEEPLNNLRIRTGIPLNTLIDKKSDSDKKQSYFTVCAVIGSAIFSSHDIEEFDDGTIIEFIQNSEEPIEIYIEEYNLLIAKGDPVVIDEFAAIIITDKLFKLSQLNAGIKPMYPEDTENTKTCRLIYGKTRMTLADIKKLKKGSDIVFDNQIGGPFKFETGSRLLEANAVVIDEKFGAVIDIEDKNIFMEDEETLKTVSIDRKKHIVRVLNDNIFTEIESILIAQGYRIKYI